MVMTVDRPINLEALDDKTLKALFLYFVFGDDESTQDRTPFTETGDKIVSKLKGSPLAAKTVGRILRNQLDVAHWNKVLENYRFGREELINFWIGLGVLHSSHGENKRIEDIGLSHLTELVSYGFLENKDGSKFYTIHDLLHELARKVSSHECLSIDSSQSQVRSLQIPPSVRHMSINIDATSVVDRLARKTFVQDFSTLDKKIKVEKLRSLMLFGNHHGCFVKSFSNLFREAMALRVIFLSDASYDVEDLLHNFYNLVHLRYLRIGIHHLYASRFPTKISRFYQMMVLDARQCDITNLPRGVSNLAKLRHFLVKNGTTHSRIVEVGKLKSLQELRSFVVKQEDQGFELRQIGELEEICGSLCIDNLENVKTTEEADEAKLMQKSHLHELIFCWNKDQSTNDSTLEEHVLERLRPSSNLLKLSVKGHRGTTCPSWLGTNLSVKNLESLCLEDVAWRKFPPIGELWLVDLPREEYISGSIPDRRFENLRRLELVNLSCLKHWAIHAPCQLFPVLEVLIIKDCPQLMELSFQHYSCCRQVKEVNANLFPRLKKLEIRNCPQLLLFPPVPWSEVPDSIDIEGTGSSCFDILVCTRNENNYEYSLTIKGKKDTTDSTLWNVLDFRNLTGLTKLWMDCCESLPLCYLQMLSSLRTLDMSCSSNTYPFVEADSHVKHQFPVERLSIIKWNASGKELTQLLTYFPELSYLLLRECKKVTGLAVRSMKEQQQGPRAEDDDVIVASEEAERGLLLLPPQRQLQELDIRFCPELSLLRSNPHDDSNEVDGRTGGGGGSGLQDLTSLRQLEIFDCPKLLSAYSSSFFSSSLEDLTIEDEVGTGTPVPLSNLTSLTSLSIIRCGDLRGKGLLSLLAKGHLTKLIVKEMPNFFVNSEPSQSQVHEQEIPSCSSKLQELQIDDVAGFSAMPIHRGLLFSSLTKLEIYGDDKVERFTEQQEALLFVNSLEDINFWCCSKLQSLPKWLHRLPNLKRLLIWWCRTIQLPPKDVLPSSLEELSITDCPKIQSLHKDCLPDSLQKLVIRKCPAILSLPKVDDLPSSLREIDVHMSKSKELRSQCRKLINIIPIVYA